MNSLLQRLLLAGTLLAALIAMAWLVPFEAAVDSIAGWAEQRPLLAFSAALLGTAMSIILAVPITITALLCGFLFGWLEGLLIVWLAGMVASTATFWIGQTLLREALERRIRKRATFKALDRAIHRNGFQVVLLARLVMVLPYIMLNYCLGLTGIRLRDYFWATNIGMLPPFALLVFLGSTSKNLATAMSGEISLTTDQWLIGGLAAAMVLATAALIYRLAGKTLREEMLSPVDESVAK